MHALQHLLRSMNTILYYVCLVFGLFSVWFAQGRFAKIVLLLINLSHIALAKYSCISSIAVTVSYPAADRARTLVLDVCVGPSVLRGCPL